MADSALLILWLPVIDHETSPLVWPSRTTENFESKINQTYDVFGRKMADDPAKVGEFYEHAKELKENAQKQDELTAKYRTFRGTARPHHVLAFTTHNEGCS